jgi:hypothetical protein
LDLAETVGQHGDLCSGETTAKSLLYQPGTRFLCTYILSSTTFHLVSDKFPQRTATNWLDILGLEGMISGNASITKQTSEREIFIVTGFFLKIF